MNTFSDQYREIVRAMDGAGTVFVPGDVESLYSEWAGEEGWPEWSDDIEAHVLDSWEWNKGIQDLLTERGWEIIGQMINDQMRDYEPKKGLTDDTESDKV